MTRADGLEIAGHIGVAADGVRVVRRDAASSPQSAVQSFTDENHAVGSDTSQVHLLRRTVFLFDNNNNNKHLHRSLSVNFAAY